MALTREEREFFAKEIRAAGRPLVFYDDDADGLTSFLLVQKANPDAIGVRGGRGPELDVDFVRKIEENLPDLVVILDKPRVDPDFFEEHSTPSIWLDHHDPNVQEPNKWNKKHLTYLNPRLHNDKDGRPVSYWVYRALGGPLWLATIGCTGDWDDSLLKDFKKEHPALAPKTLSVERALYESELGELVRIFNFSLKGSSKQIRKNISVLSKLEDPAELLQRTSARSRLVWKHYLPLVTEFEQQRAAVKNTRVKGGLLVHVFTNVHNSLIAEVANEQLVTRNAKIILIGRRVDGDVKFSMRSHKENLPAIVENALQTVSGYGGGHREACGGSIREDDWDEFVDNIRKQL